MGRGRRCGSGQDNADHDEELKLSADYLCSCCSHDSLLPAPAMFFFVYLTGTLLIYAKTQAEPNHNEPNPINSNRTGQVPQLASPPKNVALLLPAPVDKKAR